jgi:hypothetical protein
MREAEKRYREAVANGTFSLGSCERCGQPYETTPSGRIADHVCADRSADVPKGPQPIVELAPPRNTASWYEKEYDLD